MARPKSDVLTEAEQRVMRVLWEREEASVRDVTEALEATSKPLAYNTTLTILRILTDKGYVTPRQEGRAFVYRALVSRSEARTQALKKLVSQFFEGSPTALAQHLFQNSELSATELEALRDELEDLDKPAAQGRQQNRQRKGDRRG
ncbi:MAG: BlaI/MecI/CopY family transcriptional regulator [Hyphomonadaceae bacterium]